MSEKIISRYNPFKTDILSLAHLWQTFGITHFIFVQGVGLPNTYCNSYHMLFCKTPLIYCILDNVLLLIKKWLRAALPR